LNWRGIARRVVEARPEWGAVLVDLRGHGDSQGFPAPHTLEACVEDLDAPIASLDAPLRVVIGHSFGGKVALLAAERHARDLAATWIVDSPPGARDASSEPEGALRVLGFLESRRYPVESRAAFLEAASSEGLSESTASWLAMNLVRRSDGRQELGIDLAVIRSMLEDYLRVDLWRIVEAPPVPLRFVLGGRSPLFDANERERLDRAARSSRVSVEVVPDAGHWVHADRPDLLVQSLVENLPAAR
jgi:pimeloyl-ACP methyl ester carboxylesterase